VRVPVLIESRFLDYVLAEPTPRPPDAELRATRCRTCGGLPSSAAKWIESEWKPGRFCSCPF
jgi:hypothetical protein